MFIPSPLSNEDNCVVAAYQLLTTMLVPVTRSTLSASLHEHPDYPSLLSVSDVLRAYKVNNICLRTNLEHFLQLTTPCMVQFEPTKEVPYESFTVVRSVSGHQIDIYNLADHRWNTISAETFAKQWTGIVLVPEAADEAGEKDYDQNKRKHNRNVAVAWTLLLAIPVVSLAASLQAIHQAGAQAIYPIVYLLLALAGTAVTTLLLWYELDQYNPLLQKICSAGRKVNCAAVLHSKGAKIAGIGWSTIGFGYFAGTLLTLLFAGLLQLPTLTLLAWLNAIALPYVFFSIYYQWRIAKQWCILCLYVQGILVLQFLTALAAGWHTIRPLSGISNSIAPLLAFLVPLIGTALLLPAIRDRKEGRLKVTELLRLKHNPEIFASLLARQKAVTDTMDGIGIVYGSPDAPTRIIKVCNPYCGPCAKAHTALHDLVRANPDIQIQIIFTATNHENDIKAPPVKHLLAIAEKNDEPTLIKALDDWYLTARNDYDAFAAKYPMNGELRMQDDKVEAMNSWCERMEIVSTPTFFVSLPSMNGAVHQLPQPYGINDLKYFLI